MSAVKRGRTTMGKGTDQVVQRRVQLWALTQSALSQPIEG